MRIAIGSDKAGYELKEKVKAYLLKNGHEVGDFGTEDPQDPLAYYEAAHNVCRQIMEGRSEKGILICGTGAGMCIHANKHQGIFAVVCESVYSAKLIPFPLMVWAMIIVGCSLAKSAMSNAVRISSMS